MSDIRGHTLSRTAANPLYTRLKAWTRRSARSRAAAASAAVLILGLTAACASSTAASQSNAQTGQAVGSSPRADYGVGDPLIMQPGSTCPSTSTDPAIAKLRAGTKQVALPPDFRPVAAVRCEFPIRTVPGDGEWQFADAQRADSGMAQLVAALRLPSQTAAPGALIACPAMGMAMPPFALVDAKGNIVSPLLPHDVCGFPLQQVTKAVDALPWRTETEQRLHQTRTQAEIDTGCSASYKYLFEYPVSDTPEPWSKVRHPMSPPPTVVCVYAVDPSTFKDYIAIGSFTRGAKLTPAQQTAVVKAFDDASGTGTPAPTCTAKATRFVSVDGPGTMVELDGCKRVRWPNNFMSTAPDSLLQLLASLVIG